MSLASENRIEPDPYKVDLTEINMSDSLLYEQGLARRYFQRLRREAPIHFLENSPVGPFWSITKFKDILEISRNHKDFSADSSRGGHILGYEDWLSADPEMPMMIAMDPPRHGIQRSAVSPAMAAPNVRKMEAGIRKNASDILNSLPEDDIFDWVEKVSVELTMRTLAVLFEFPIESIDKLKRWSDLMLAVPGNGVIDSWEQRKKEILEMARVFRELRNERKGRTDAFDIVSLIANSLDADSLTEEEFLGNIGLLVIAGNDTTRNSLTGSVLALNLFPTEEAKLRASPQLIPNFCSEAIRWQTPVTHMKRNVVRDTKIDGYSLKEGDKVVMWYTSGNNDEDVIENGDTLLADRPNANNHLSFGFGIHRCVGSRVAELQLRIAWEEMLKRFRSIEVVGSPVRLRSHVLDGYLELPVRVKRF